MGQGFKRPGDHLHIEGKRHGKFLRFTCDGMLKAQRSCVKHHAWNLDRLDGADFSASVGLITKYGMPQ